MGEEFYHEKLQCFVEELKYNWETRLGTLLLPSGNCTDLTGCVQLFAKLDERVQRIDVVSKGYDRTLYYREGVMWSAMRAELPPGG